MSGDLRAIVSLAGELVKRLPSWRISNLAMDCRGYGDCSRTGRRPRSR